MRNGLALKLSQFTRLSAADLAALEKLRQSNVRQAGPREDLIHEGDRPRHVNLILSGWAHRYKTLEDGRRQILAFFVPGDLCDLNVYILKAMDHSIAALTRLTYAEVPREALEEVMLAHPRITQALWWESLVNVAIQREWTLNLGQRSAIERIAHLFCELFYRLRSIGHTIDHRCEMPITQTDIADAVGLTPVHVNRTLQDMRAEGLIRLDRYELHILDLARLKQVAMFNPNYLHLDREGAHLDANE